MSKPQRVPDTRTGLSYSRTFFVTSRTAGGRPILQSRRMADLLIEVLKSLHARDGFVIHDFVVMPNHIHVLLTVPGNATVEKAVQLIKGGFSFRANRELGFSGEIWERGFSDVGVRDRDSFLRHREYIEQNPVKAGLAASAEQYVFGSAHLKWEKKQGLKPTHDEATRCGTNKFVP